MINLCLVVIATQFSETKRRETERMLAERARRSSKHRSQSSSTVASSAGLGVGGCYVELVHLLEHLANRARRRVARFFRRLRRHYAARQSSVPGDVDADRPRALVVADFTPGRRRRRRRRHRDLDPRSPDAPVTADNSPRGRAEQPDSAPATHGVVACRVGPHTLSEAAEIDGQSSPSAVPPRRAKLLAVANAECLQICNTGLSRLISHTIQLQLFVLHVALALPTRYHRS